MFVSWVVLTRCHSSPWHQIGGGLFRTLEDGFLIHLEDVLFIQSNFICIWRMYGTRLENMKLRTKICTLDPNLVVLGAQLADGLACDPHLVTCNVSKLLLELNTVVGSRVLGQGAASLSTVGDGFVQLLEDGLGGGVELLPPVESTTLSSGGAVSVHPVHAVSTDQGVKRLGGLLDGLVESLRGGVTASAEDLVLGNEETLDGAHQDTTLTVEIGVDLLLEGGLVKVAGTDTDTEGNSALLGLARDVLVNGDGSVDAATLEEEVADGSAGALGGNEDDINVLGGDDASVLGVDDGESVREVEGLALGEVGLDLVPELGLGSVGEQVHDDSSALAGLGDLEQVLAGDPALGDGLVPGGTLAGTNDDVQLVVAEVEGLATTHGAVAEDGEGVVLESLLELGCWVVGALVNNLLGAGKVDGFNTASLGESDLST